MKRLERLLATLFMLSWSSILSAVQVPGPLVETDWLDKHQGEVVILDVRKDTKSFTEGPVFKTDKKTGKRQLEKTGGHIPGAVLVNYKHVHAARAIEGEKVTHLIPEKADFENLMRKSGVNRDSAVVIVIEGKDNEDLTMATRLYWELKYYGHDNMSILNGGLAQWLVDGKKIVMTAAEPSTGNWQATAERGAILAGTADVMGAMQTGSAQLVDNRPLGEYLGIRKKTTVHANGHIPGARVFPGELMGSERLPAKFLPADELRQLLQAMHIRDQAATITYCNSGQTASEGWFILSELLGNRDVRLYDASMQEWTLKKLPVNTMKME